MPLDEPKACYRCKHFGQAESEIAKRDEYPVWQWFGLCMNEKSPRHHEFLSGGETCDCWELKHTRK